MKTCVHCNKQLNVGDEAHIIDEDIFCSKECAVLHIADEIAMNAKELAIECYDEKATILTVRPEANHAMCGACDKDLAKCDTIWAAEGRLYCSRECGIHDYNVTHENAEEYFDSVAEEISPSDIGLEPWQTMTRTEIFQAIESLAKSTGRYSRLYANLMDDSEYRGAVLDDLEAQEFKDVVDLVLYLES